MKHIVFDMDGVIVDTEPEYKRRNGMFFKSKGIHISDDVYNLTCGSDLKGSYEIFRKYVDGFHMTFEEYEREKKAYTQGKPIDVTKCVDPDIYPLLSWLKERRFHIALATSSPERSISRYLSALKIEDYFELKVSGTRFARSKPDPEIYRYTMERLKVEPSKCLVVEDSTYGIMAAKAAGAIVIGKKDERFGYDQSGADYLIKHLTEIVEIISKVTKVHERNFHESPFE